MVTIQILSDGYDRYTLKADSDCLGRRYDNISEAIRVIKPEVENGRKCEIIVKSGDEIIEYQEVKEETVDITTNISQHNIVSIGFTFSDDSGYIKNSESKDFYFASAIKPQGFIDIPSDKMNQVIEIISKGFVRAEYSNNMLMFYNTKDEMVGSVEIVGGSGSEYTETDPTVPAWAKQPEKPKYIYSEIEGTPLIPSVDGLASESFVNTKTSEVLNESKTYTNQKVADLVNSAPETLDTLGELAVAIQENESVVDAINQAISNKADKDEIPTLTSQLENDGDGNSKFATEQYVQDAVAGSGSELPENLVTTDTDQSITGTKTFDKMLFSDAVTIDGLNADGLKVLIGKNQNVTGENQIAIGNDVTINGDWDGIAIGRSAKGRNNAVGIGSFARANSEGAVVIGSSSSADYNGVAIGRAALSSGSNTIQIGKGTNHNAGTFQVRDYQLLDASGNIPIERLANVTSLIETSIVGVLNTEV